MYQKGTLVMYGIHGVCRILDIEIQKVDRKRIEFFVLEPVEQPGARFFVPTQNEAAVSKLKPLLTRQQLDDLLRESALSDNSWIEDENQRKQYYRTLISSGDRKALIRMVASLYKHKEVQASAGRKFHLCDENFLRDAVKLLNAEFSLVLNIEQDEVGAYVQDAINER